MNSKNKQLPQKNRVPEKNHLEEVAGYDRHFDPVAEAYDLAIAKKMESQKKQRL